MNEADSYEELIRERYENSGCLEDGGEERHVFLSCWA